MPPRSSKDGDDRSTEIQFELQEIRDGIHAFRSQEPLQSRQIPDGLLMIDNQVYKLWENFILIWAVYSSCFTPLEFCFFRGLPSNLFFLNIAVQIAFLPDIILQFYVTRRNPTSTTFDYFGFIFDSLSCLPWDLIYKLCGRKEVVRYFLWIRLCRLRKVARYLQKMEGININYLFTWIVNTIIAELYCMHNATCIFYYFATTLPQSKDDYTWIWSLKLGEHNFQNLWEIDFWKCYLRSLYIAIVAMPTVDSTGATPLLEAIKCKQDRLASLLLSKGAALGLENCPDLLCTAASRGDSDFLKRVLYFGADPNLTNYNDHTALHIAASEGFYLMAEILLEAGASVFSVDRWGITPLDEALKGGSPSFIKLFENAKSKELLKFPGRTQLFPVKPPRFTIFSLPPSPERNERGIFIPPDN